MQLRYVLMSDWPVQAWLAVGQRGNDPVVVYHGCDVETFPDWFCEAAWTGEFGLGEFDQVETVVGSGGRRRGEELIFVSASSTVDRLQSMDLGDRVLVSNSLPGVLQAAGGVLPPSYPRYNREVSSVQYGLTKYQRFLATSAGPLELIYYDNLVWDGQRLRIQPKPEDKSELTDYEHYVGFLEDSLRAISRNASSPQRRKKHYSLLGTVSSGYDSPTVAALATRCGCAQAICFDQGQGGVEDSGAEIAARLGLEVLPVSRMAWLTKLRPEIPIIAGGVLTSVIFAGAEQHLAGRILLTGYHGDKVWAIKNDSLGPEIVRGDCSGLGLTEYRLWAGFLHAPLPFWAVRRIQQIHTISNSDEMKPFLIAGTSYNRPICRRLVEQAGVPRELFGMRKRAADLQVWQESRFLTDESLKDYLEWLHQNRWQWYRRLRIPPWRSVRGDEWLNHVNVRAVAWAKSLAHKSRSLPGLHKLNVQPVLNLNPRLINLRQYYFAWAVERAKERYSRLPPAVAD